MENELYSNTKYSFERDESKTIIINVVKACNATNPFNRNVCG